MRKKELIKALSKVEEGIADLKNLLILDEQSENSTQSVKESNESESVEGRFSKEDLDAMKYNDLKKLGKELGVKCTGTREEITEKILAVPVGVPMNEPIEDEEEPEVEEKSNVVPMKKKSSNKKEVEEVEEEDDEIEEQYLELAREALEDNTLEDVVEILEEVGVKLTARQKKKQDVVMTKLAEAFQNGMIDTDEEDEEEDADEEDSTDEDEMEFSEDSYFDVYDPEGINDPSNMTKKRAKAIKKLVADIISSYEEEEITSDDIESELEDIVTDDDVELLGEDYSEEELLAFYIEMKKRFVDDDGTICDPSDPYEIGKSNFCCGHELVYDKKGNKYVCPVCEEEYEAD